VSCSGDPSVRREISIRVLHVAPTAFGDDGLFGGGERYPFELAHALAHVDGVQCEFVTFGSVPRIQVVDGLKIRVIRVRGHLHRHPGHPLAALPLSSIRHADVVHVHHPYSTSSRIAALLAAAVGARTVATDHGLVARDRFGLVPRLFDAFLPVSKYAARVMRAPPDRTMVVYGGADPHRFRPENEPRAGALYVGRLTPHKGVDRAIAALPDGAELTIAGTGGHDPSAPERDYERHLRWLARGRDVRFLGAVSDRELAVLYRRAAVVVVPSVERTCYGKRIAVSELLGLTTLEAMASATPVVASNLGGLGELVVDGVTGYLTPPGDAVELRARLVRLLPNPAEIRVLGEAARRRVLERFTWDACAHRCLRAYEALVTGAKRDSHRTRWAIPKSAQ
jgi:alpha-maltose-1-phosphate synthase